MRTLTVPENPAGPQAARSRCTWRGSRRSAAASSPIRCSCWPAAPARPPRLSTPRCAGAFARIHRDRDIVLVDQRGTGRLEPPELPGGRGHPLPPRTMPRSQAQTRTCLAALAAARRRRPTTPRARGAGPGAGARARSATRASTSTAVSYGTRVAQHYLRRYPRHVRAVILDGVVPPQTGARARMWRWMRNARCRHPRALRRRCAPASALPAIRTRTTAPCAPR